nr:MAG TPA: leucine-rich repeat protein [Caudoviricetes sp.]
MSVNIKYKNNSIAELTDTGTKTLKTAGKYCEADIVVENTKDGGATITDGIVIKARDAEGLATSIDVYGSEVYYRQFYSGSQYTAGEFDGWNNVQTVNLVSATKIGKFGMGAMQQLHTITGLENVVELANNAFYYSGTKGSGFNFVAHNCTKISGSAFEGSGVLEADCPNVTTLENGAFLNCSKLISAKFPKISKLGQYSARMFKGCTALTTAEFGSIGYPITSKADDSPFVGCTQANLTITAFVRGNFVDALLANFRDGATNATIIIKAAEATTYNGTEYAAGNTIITSTVEAEGTA